jgi:predicted ATPase
MRTLVRPNYSCPSAPWPATLHDNSPNRPASPVNRRARPVVGRMPVHVAGDRHAGVAEQVGYREELGMANQQVWPVSSLDVVAGTGSAVVKLFVERAQAVSSRFSIGNPQEADAVVEICRRLDGIPLAIELAASRMASMTASEVRDRLDQRFRLLVGSRRGLAQVPLSTKNSSPRWHLYFETVWCAIEPAWCPG